MDISVIIPTFNRSQILFKTLEHLANQTYPKEKYEIVVVDDNSTENIQEVIEKVKNSHPELQLIYLKQDENKKGPAAANNLGIKSAKGKYILLMNNDVIADKHLIEEHIKTHLNSKGSIIAQGRVINTSSIEELGKKHKGYSGGYSNFSFGYFTTWNCSVEKETLLKAGLFDEDFRNLCWEDVELGFRLRKMGIKQKNNPKAFGYHFKHEFSLKDLDKIKEKSINMGKNAVLYYKKHKCLEVKISTENFFLPMFVHTIFSLLIRMVGKEKILYFFRFLEKTGKNKTLGFFVGLSGKYWFWSGVKEGNKNK